MIAPHWECPAGCSCHRPTEMPPEWPAAEAAGDMLIAAPREPGASISNGYVGAWLPISLPGSAGPPMAGIEHVHGVFAASTPAVLPTGARKVFATRYPPRIRFYLSRDHVFSACDEAR